LGPDLADDGEKGLPLAGFADSGEPLAVPPIENQDFIPLTTPHDLREVTPLRRRKGELPARGEIVGDVKSDHASS
jgi:hypothetical protein